MLDKCDPICVERILVSLDSSSHSFAALQAAVDLARHYRASLHGVFIEDKTLLSIAEMPFRQEVGQYTAIVRDISTDSLARGILIQSRWVVRTFHKIVNQTDLQGDISVLRGHVIDTIINEAMTCDLLIVGKSGTNPVAKYKLGSTTRALIQKSQKSLLLVEEKTRLGFPMIVLFDDSTIGQISLETARDLLDPGEDLLVLICNDEVSEFERNKKILFNWASEQQVNIMLEPYKTNSFNQFLEMIKGLKNGLLILPFLQDADKRQIVEKCLINSSLPILLIREPKKSK